MISLFHWFVKLTGWIPQRLMFRTKVLYEDKSIQDRHIRGKAIVVSNHRRIMDYAVMMFVFWNRTLRCAVAEVVYKKNFIMPLLLKCLGCVSVERDHHDFTFLAKLKYVLDRGGVAEIYPESRLPKDGEDSPIEFKPSYVHLALETDAPIIPVYNSGKIPGHKHEYVIIGKPVFVGELHDSNLSEKENIQKINDYVRSRIIELGQEFQTRQKEAVS